MMVDLIERSAAIEAACRPIIGIENRTPTEVFDVMCNRFKMSIPHRFTREDVEKAARAHCDRFGGQGWFDSGESHEPKADMIEAMAVALSAIGEVDHG